MLDRPLTIESAVPVDFFTSEISLEHDGNTNDPAPDDPANLLTLLGTGGAVGGIADGFGSASGGVNSIGWELTQANPDYGDGDTIVGLDLTVVLPNLGNTVTDGEFTFFFAGGNDEVALRAIPEPSSVLICAGVGFCGLLRRKRYR